MPVLLLLVGIVFVLVIVVDDWDDEPRPLRTARSTRSTNSMKLFFRSSTDDDWNESPSQPSVQSSAPMVQPRTSSRLLSPVGKTGNRRKVEPMPVRQSFFHVENALIL